MSKGLRKIQEKIGFMTIRLATLLVIFILAYILYDIFSKGLGSISWEFITAKPRKGMTEGGIWPAIAGTFWVKTPV